MAYYWHIKRYKEEPIRVKPKMASQAIELWMRSKTTGKEEIIVLPGNVGISTNSVSAIEPSLDVIEDENIYRLASGENIELKPYGKGKATIGPDYEQNGVRYTGGVLCNWYKKNIDKREWENYYCKIGSYYRIDASDRSTWVAM
jgi:hypothetical protein